MTESTSTSTRINHDETVTTEVGRFSLIQRNCGYADNDGRLMNHTAAEPFDLMELYRNSDGHEVWRVYGLDGRVAQDNISSDHDAEWIATRIFNEGTPRNV